MRKKKFFLHTCMYMQVFATSILVSVTSKKIATESFSNYILIEWISKEHKIFRSVLAKYWCICTAHSMLAKKRTKYGKLYRDRRCALTKYVTRLSLF